MTTLTHATALGNLISAYAGPGWQDEEPRPTWEGDVYGPTHAEEAEADAWSLGFEDARWEAKPPETANRSARHAFFEGVAAGRRDRLRQAVDAARALGERAGFEGGACRMPAAPGRFGDEARMLIAETFGRGYAAGRDERADFERWVEIQQSPRRTVNYNEMVEAGGVAQARRTP